MPYCSQCGVEVHSNTEKCPLCKAPIQKIPLTGNPEQTYPPFEADKLKLPPLTKREKLYIARGISVLTFLIPIFISISIDYFINNEITWSLYVIISLSGVLLITLTALFIPHKGSLINLFTHIITALFLFGINMVSENSFLWSIKLALPILFVSLLTAQSVILISRKKRGHITASAIIGGIGIDCLAVDFFLKLQLENYSFFGWSIITLIAILPIIVLLLFIQSTRYKDSKNKRFFHV